jgi:hypothetical protein
MDTCGLERVERFRINLNEKNFAFQKNTLTSSFREDAEPLAPIPHYLGSDGMMGRCASARPGITSLGLRFSPRQLRKASSSVGLSMTSPS